MFCAAGKSFLEFGRVRTSISTGPENVFGSFERLANAACSRDVVVLDQHGVEKPATMIHRASRRRRHFFELPQSRRGLASIENAHLRSGDSARHACARAWRCR